MASFTVPEPDEAPILPRSPDRRAKATTFAAFDELETLDPLACGAEQEDGEGPPFLCFTSEALEVFTEWRTDFEAGLRLGDLFPALESHLAKYRKLVPALALVFHLADGHSGPVGFASTLRALHWSTYLQTHARRCYGVAQSGEADTARRILERIAKGDLQREGFGSRDVWRPSWAGLADQKRVADGLPDAPECMDRCIPCMAQCTARLAVRWRRLVPGEMNMGPRILVRVTNGGPEELNPVSVKKKNPANAGFR